MPLHTCQKYPQMVLTIFFSSTTQSLWIPMNAPTNRPHVSFKMNNLESRLKNLKVMDYQILSNKIIILKSNLPSIPFVSYSKAAAQIATKKTLPGFLGPFVKPQGMGPSSISNDSFPRRFSARLQLC